MYDRTVVDRNGNLVALLRYFVSAAISSESASKESWRIRDCSENEKEEMKSSKASSEFSAGSKAVTLPC